MTFIRCLSLALVGACALGAQAPRTAAPTVPARPEPPAWAMPLGTGAPAAPDDSVTPRRVPGSTVAFTQLRAHNRYDVPDWYPESHPAMPAVVARGRRPAVWACGYCHLPDGAGRPENAALAGLPEKYIIRQMAAFRSGQRGSPWHAPNKPADIMLGIADSATAAEVKDAARYFSRLGPRQRARVVEAERIPRVKPGTGLYFLADEGGEEPLGERLIEVATDAERHELHDARVEYVAYVPPGSIARGQELAKRGVPGAKSMTACASCHGSKLRGAGPAPPIAGRAPSYLLRQLMGFAAGSRSTKDAAPMRAVAGELTLKDMISAAAFAGSLAP
ncbi:MAG TPA: c-type cytochrome [Gemmatimonadaceae bacterium]|nr:c-type cytochrome [Gemmatimonadaceae bacterium]